MEAKAAHTGTPADLFKPLSAFANWPGGGVLLFGLDEDAGFLVVGVGNPRKLQEDLSGLAAQMEPPLRPSFSVEEIEGGIVVAVEVMFADRLEVQNPGGLYGGVTVDELKEGQSTRNLLLVQLMEDVHLVENRGSGIDAMLEAMQKRGLPSPVFEDKRTAFLVKFYQVMPAEISVEEKKILAYVKEHGSIKRSEAQKMLEVSDRRAKYVLEKMETARLLRQEGQQKGARYLLI